MEAEEEPHSSSKCPNYPLPEGKTRKKTYSYHFQLILGLFVPAFDALLTTSFSECFSICLSYSTGCCFTFSDNRPIDPTLIVVGGGKEEWGGALFATFSACCL